MTKINVFCDLGNGSYRTYETESFDNVKLFDEEWHVTRKRNPEDGSPVQDKDGDNIYVLTHGGTGYCVPGIEDTSIGTVMEDGIARLSANGKDHVMGVIAAVKEFIGAPINPVC